MQRVLLNCSSTMKNTIGRGESLQIIHYYINFITLILLLLLLLLLSL